MTTHRLYVSSIGGLPLAAIKTLFERSGEVEDVVLLSPKGNPVAIVVLHSDEAINTICSKRLAYSLTSEGKVIEQGMLGLQPARVKPT